MPSPFRVLFSLLLLALFLLVNANAAPDMAVSSQELGVLPCNSFYVDVNVTVPGTLYNATFNVTLLADEVPFYSSLTRASVYVTIDGEPTYYWTMRRTRTLFTIYFFVPVVEREVTVRIHYGADNPYVGYRQPRRLFLYYSSFIALPDYDHYPSGAFPVSLPFDDGELSTRSGRLVVSAELPPDTAKEARFTSFDVDGTYEVAYKLRRATTADVTGFHVHAFVSDSSNYYYAGILENGTFSFRLGTPTGVEDVGSVDTNYYVVHLFLNRGRSWGTVEKYTTGEFLGQGPTGRGFRTVSVGLGQANLDNVTVNLLAYVDWLYVMKRYRFETEVVGMGVECG